MRIIGENTAMAAAAKYYRATNGKWASEVQDRRSSLAGQKVQEP